MNSPKRGLFVLCAIGIALIATGLVWAGDPPITNPQGYLTSVLVLGSYEPAGCDPGDDGIHQDFLSDGVTTEGNIVPYDGMPLGLPVGGTTFRANSQPSQSPTPLVKVLRRDDAYFDFNLGLPATENCMCYAWVYVKNMTGKAVPVMFGLGSDDSAQLRVNRAEVIRARACRGVGGHRIQNVGHGVLLPGWNILQYKVFNGCCGYALVASLSYAVNNNKPIVDDGVNFDFALELPAGEVLATPPVGGSATRTVGPVSVVGDETIVPVRVDYDTAGVPAVLGEYFGSLWTPSDYGTASYTEGYYAIHVSYNPSRLAWIVSGTGSVSYTLKTKAYLRVGWEDQAVAGSLVLGAEKVLEAPYFPDAFRRTTGGPTTLATGTPRVRRNFIQSILLTPPIRQPIGAYPPGFSGAMPPIEAMKMDWISGGGLTDAKIIPSDGLVLKPEFGGASIGTGWGVVGAEQTARFFDADGNGRLARVDSTGAGYDFNGIWGAANDDSLGIAYFYMVNPTDKIQLVPLAFGSDDSLRIDLNGRPVHFMPVPRGAGRTDPVVLPLDPGRNLVTCYVWNGGGGFGLWLRPETPWGNSVADEWASTDFATGDLDPTGYDPNAPHNTLPIDGARGVLNVLLTPPIRMTKGGCDITTGEMAGGWMVGVTADGTPFDDRNIIPYEGMEFKLDFGAGSQGTDFNRTNDVQRRRFFSSDLVMGKLYKVTSNNGNFETTWPNTYNGAADNSMCVGYFFVEVPEAKAYTVLVGSDDGVSVRVNGHLAYARQACRGTDLNFQNGGNPDIFRIALNKGKNLIAISAYNGGGGFGFGMMFLDERGVAVRMPTTTDPTGYDPAAHPTYTVPETPVYLARGIVGQFLRTNAPMDSRYYWEQILANALPEDIALVNGKAPEAGEVRENALVQASLNPYGVTRWVRGGCGALLVKQTAAIYPWDAGLWDGNATFGYHEGFSGTLFFYLNNKTAEEQLVFLGVGSDDAAAVFVNGQPVLQFLWGRGWGASNQIQDPGIRPAVLKPGLNLVQATFTQGGGEAGIRVGVFDGTADPHGPGFMPGTPAYLKPLDTSKIEVIPDPYGPMVPAGCLTLGRVPQDEDAFKELEYVAHIEGLGVVGLPLAYTAISPPGATVDASGTVRYQIPLYVAAGTEIPFEVDVASGTLSQKVSWKVRVVKSVRHDFDSLAEAASFTIVPGDGTAGRLAEAYAKIEDGYLKAFLPGPSWPDFDHWCGFDRTPRMLHNIRAFSTFNAETYLFLDTANFPPTDEYHVGLALDRGLQDLLIHGIIRDDIQVERNCCKDGDCSGVFFENVFSDPLSAPGTTLRIEKRGMNEKYFAWTDQAADPVLVREVNAPRPWPTGVGLAVKSWGGQGNVGVWFEYFEYGSVVPCPKIGDTHATALQVVGPEGDLEGTYVATATAADDSGDTIIYTFKAQKGAEPPITVGPQFANTASFDLTAGDWTISVSVDDDPDCPDVAADATKAVTLTVKPPTPPGGLVKPFDMNKDCKLDISDPVALLNHLFLGGLGPYCGNGEITDPANVELLNANGDAAGIDLSDAIYVLNFLFLGGPMPVMCADNSCPLIRIVGCPDTCR